MNNENEEEKNTVIERQKWHVKEYCCDTMMRHIKGASLMRLELATDGSLMHTRNGDYRCEIINFCPNCGAKVITK